MIDSVEVSSNWKVAGESELRNVIKCRSTLDEAADSGLDDVTHATCVCLIPSNTCESKPEMYITSAQPLTTINIISEAQIIEVFGSSQEYVTTCHADFVDDWEGMSVYQAAICTSDLSKCTLKFTRIREIDRLWIYGVSLTLQPIESQEPSSMRFNFQNVNNLIGKSSNQISEKAEKFKNFFQSYTATAGGGNDFPKLNNMPPNLLLRMLETQYATQIKNCKRNVTHCLSTIASSGQTSDEDVKCFNKDPNKDEHQIINPKDSSLQDLKSYIDTKFHMMERNLKWEIERQFNEMQAANEKKLNRIIDLLEQKSVKHNGSKQEATHDEEVKE